MPNLSITTQKQHVSAVWVISFDYLSKRNHKIGFKISSDLYFLFLGAIRLSVTPAPFYYRKVEDNVSWAMDLSGFFKNTPEKPVETSSPLTTRAISFFPHRPEII
ncbi:MAG: hypothetical protein Q8L68_02750 [Methylococcales bacterium]|nr:hypothetical protein [Methylococcales bacterium]